METARPVPQVVELGESLEHNKSRERTSIVLAARSAEPAELLRHRKRKSFRISPGHAAHIIDEYEDSMFFLRARNSTS